MEESDPAYPVAEKIHSLRDSLATVRLFVITDAVLKSFDVDKERIQKLDVQYIAWDIDKLSRLRAGTRDTIELDFLNRYGGPIACLRTSAATGEYETYLAFLPGPLLAKIYGEFGQRLLERNVRAFLQVKGAVNRGLQKTLRDEPHRFLAYNNGLCATAAKVRVKSEPSGHALLEWAQDFQIVNGGQTSASVFHALKKEQLDISQVCVQMKLTVCSNPEHVTEIVPLISRYANSQNKVNTADFAANGPFHRTMEALSRAVWAPPASGLQRGSHWYYERARGSFADDRGRHGAAAARREWESQNPPGQRFTKTDLAKFEQSWLGHPDLVCLGGLRRTSTGSRSAWMRMASPSWMRTTSDTLSAR